MKCHQGGDARVLQPGRDYADIRPGRPLSEALAIFKLPPEPGGAADSDLLEHHFSMALSACYRGSEARLNCLSCHNPHRPPVPASAQVYYRGRCLSCHAGSDCLAPAAHRRKAGDDCIGCHMPKRDVRVISHSSLTNHRIVRRPSQPLPESAFRLAPPDLPGLIYVNRLADPSAPLPAVTALKAYAEVAKQHPELQARYLEALARVPRNVDDPVVLAALARKALQLDGDRKAAEQYFRKAIEAGGAESSTFQELSGLLAGQTEAVEILRRGLESHPYDSALHKSLALRLIELKRFDRAREVLRRYVELFPEDDFVRGLLAKVDGPR
jgi:hypothetical protein